MTDDLTRRLEAVERAVTDGHTDLASLHDAADAEARLDELERRLDEVDARLADLDATTQALRGYLGGIDGVADDVERRADLALAKAEAVEDAVFEGSDGLAVEWIPSGSSDPRRPAGDRATGTEHEADTTDRSTGSETPLPGSDVDGTGAAEDGYRSIVDRLRALL